MKKSIILLLAFFLTTGAVIARDIVTVVFKVEQMECSGCEKKVKDNVKFMKGVKSFKQGLNEVEEEIKEIKKDVESEAEKTE